MVGFEMFSSHSFFSHFGVGYIKDPYTVFGYMQWIPGCRFQGSAADVASDDDAVVDDYDDAVNDDDDYVRM